MRFTLWLTLSLLAAALACKRPTPPVIAPDIIPPDTTLAYVPDVPVEIPEPVKLTNYEVARLSIGIPGRDSINHWLAFVGLPPNNPFCSAANCAWHHYTGLWHPRSGLARHWRTMAPGGMWVPAERVLAGQVEIPAGSVVLFQQTGTVFGHVGIVTQHFTGRNSLYISANTSAPGSGGSEASGGGVYEKPFFINPGASFFISGFIVFS
jgi:hypothetical protein